MIGYRFLSPAEEEMIEARPITGAIACCNVRVDNSNEQSRP